MYFSFLTVNSTLPAFTQPEYYIVHITTKEIFILILKTYTPSPPPSSAKAFVGARLSLWAWIYMFSRRSGLFTLIANHMKPFLTFLT